MGIWLKTTKFEIGLFPQDHPQEENTNVTISVVLVSSFFKKINFCSFNWIIQNILTTFQNLDNSIIDFEFKFSYAYYLR